MMHASFVPHALIAVLFSMLWYSGLPAHAEVPDETTTITLEQPVHFIGTDGSEVVANPGEYSVEAAQEWLRLIPGTERRDALLVEAQPGTHEVKVEIPIVLSTPGSEPDELDVHVVQLLNPDGTSMVASGTYSGIQSRGLFDAAKKAAAQARARAEAARRAAAAKAAQAAEAARIAALKAKQEAERLAKEAAAKAQYLAQQATIQACKTYFKAQAAMAGLQKDTYAHVQHAVDALKKNTKFVRDAAAAAERATQAFEEKIRELASKAIDFNNPIQLGKIKAMLEPDNMCEKGLPTTQKEFMALMSPNNSGIQSRGVREQVLSLGFQLAGVSPKLLGGEGGGGLAFQPRAFSDGFHKEDFHLYRFLGGSLSLPGLKGSVSIQVPWWNPNKVSTIQNLKGGYFAIGWTIPFEWVLKEVKHIPGEQGVPGYAENSSIGVLVDLLFAWPKGQAYPDLSGLAGITLSLGYSSGLSKQFNDPKRNIAVQKLIDFLRSTTLQGGYTWVN
jgi:hypothetical protein